MPDFSELADDAKKAASEHSEQTDEGLQKAGQFADQETGNKYDSEVQKGEQSAENYLGGDQNQQNQQNQQDQQGQQQ
jgi:MT0933-like antitoxin protein